MYVSITQCLDQAFVEGSVNATAYSTYLTVKNITHPSEHQLAPLIQKLHKHSTQETWSGTACEGSFKKYANTLGMPNVRTT